MTRFAPLEAAVRDGRLSVEGAFVVRTLLIHEYRKIHLQDPLLPPELLPQDWVDASPTAVRPTLCAGIRTRRNSAVGGRALPRAAPAARQPRHDPQPFRSDRGTRCRLAATVLAPVDDALRFAAGALDRPRLADLDLGRDPDAGLDASLQFLPHPDTTRRIAGEPRFAFHPHRELIQVRRAA